LDASGQALDIFPLDELETMDVRSLSKVKAATVVMNAEVGALAGKVDFANVDDIAEVNAEVLTGLSSTDANGLQCVWC